jgi:transposase InsO family protein
MSTEEIIQQGKPVVKRRRYPLDFKLKFVKLYLEEGLPVPLIVKESGINVKTVYAWIRRYRTQGESGLCDGKRGGNHRQCPGPVKERIRALKRSNPLFGVKRISQVLRRLFFLTASPETVRRTLHQSALMSPPRRRKPQRNMVRPRFFERSTPNQLWQTDIFTFRLGGKYAYLIGYIDDYSRYITGLDLFRSQTADSVIEVYRRAAAEYNPPKEMLTDNGRQYTSWRGNSRFENELKKDRIHHIKSQPHHPMTLGKIERFWKTIFLEYLSRAQFDSFENAQERIRLWVKYYNHKRPHQGIGGLCPADRYFEIQAELRKTIEHGIQENLLEMALRGKPQAPFYMVGRMEGQSVVLRAEKGKLRLTLDNEDDKQNTQELIYNLEQGENDHGKDREDDQKTTADKELHGAGEVPGGVIDLDGTQKTGGSMPGADHTVGAAVALADAGNGRDAASVTAADQTGPGSGAEPAFTNDAGKETLRSGLSEQAFNAPCQAARYSAEQNGKSGGEDRDKVLILEPGNTHESKGQTGVGTEAHGAFDQSPFGRDDRNGRGEGAWGLTQDLVRVGEPGAGSNEHCSGRPNAWQAANTRGYGEGTAAEARSGTGEAVVPCQENRGSTGPVGSL